MNSEDKIKKAFEDKTWSEIKSEDSWQIFKVMAEFVEGFSKLRQNTAPVYPYSDLLGPGRIILIINSQKKLPINSHRMDME